MMNRNWIFVVGLSVVLQAGAAEPARWIATWGTSPAPQREEAEMRAAKLVFDGQTVREIVHCSAGGRQVRVELSNVFSKLPVEIGSAHIALRTKNSQIEKSSDRAMTFSGHGSFTIPPNAVALSDPLPFELPAGADLAISLYLPKPTIAGGVHYSSQQTAYIGSGDLANAAALPSGDTLESWVFLSSVDVVASSKKGGTIVAFGDSITDGARSTTNANHRWPDFLAERLREGKKKDKFGILDAGIGGNRILHDAVSNIRFGVSALARFDRDVLAQPGVEYLIILEGINDLGHPGTSAPASEAVTAEDMIAGLKQMVERAHEHGIKVIGATLTPFAGTAFPGYFTPEREVERKKVNAWIRSDRSLDGVIDFEAAAWDPNNHDHLLAAFDSGDHLHPNDAGYHAMADAINLKLFR